MEWGERRWGGYEQIVRIGKKLKRADGVGEDGRKLITMEHGERRKEERTERKRERDSPTSARRCIAPCSPIDNAQMHR
jgi:hypothetical protein